MACDWLACADRLAAKLTGGPVSERDREDLASLYRTANRYTMMAAVCGLAPDDPRRRVAGLLLEGVWHFEPRQLTPDEQDAALAVLLDSATAILEEPGMP